MRRMSYKVDLVSASSSLPANSTITSDLEPRIGDVFSLLIGGISTWWRICTFGNGANRVIAYSNPVTGAIGKVCIEPDFPPPPQPH